MKSHFNPTHEILKHRRLSIMPARAFMDKQLDIMAIRLLGCLCLHANKHGICWPTRETISNYTGHHPDNLSKKVTELVNRGYVRKLNPRKFKVPRRGSKWPINRYQVLYDGASTPLPSLEEFHSPKPKAIEKMDGAPTDRKDQLEQQGVEGVSKLKSLSLASAFCKTVASVTGELRMPENQRTAADKLASAGITPEQVAEATEQQALQAQQRGSPAPMTLEIVAKNGGFLT